MRSPEVNDFLSDPRAEHGVKMSDEEFEALARYENGRIVNFPLCWFMLTEDQKHRLHGDDWSYWHELEEEVQYELSLMRGEAS